jgi:dolichol kinase
VARPDPRPLTAPAPTQRPPPAHRSFRGEVRRKAIHLASAVVPAFVWAVSRPVASLVLLGIAALALTIDLSRRRLRPVRYWFLRSTRPMLRHRERRGLAGATWMAIAYAAAVIVFPTPVAVVAMLYAALGDAAAALVGRRWGRWRLPGGKTVEGALGGLLVSLLAGLAVPGIGIVAALAGATVAAGLEAADLPPDDNLWVVLGGGASLWLVMLLGG